LRAVLGGRSELLLGGQHVVPKKLVDTGFQFQFEDLPSALVDLTG
jgi:hypothetical protein